MKISNRDIIIHTIEHFPGIRYKELMKIVRLSYGTLSYHLRRMEKEGFIKVDRTNKVTRFYTVNINELEYIVLKLCRNPIRRMIMQYLITHNQATLEEIMQYASRSRSTITWHLKILRKNNLITINKINKTLLYSLNERDKISCILRKFSTCFIANRH